VPTPPLTRRQRQILDFYRDYSEQHRISPTLEEVAQHFGVNKVTIFGHVAELERKGILSRAARGISRGLTIVATSPGREPSEPREGESGPAWRGGGASSATAVPPATAVPSGTAVRVLGRIAAGRPIETIEEPEELELADLLPRDRDVYALRVRGDSMIDDGIRDGDLVLVERRTEAHDGETVVAILPGEEATLKRLYREAGGWRLEPANASLQPIHASEIEVRGVVIGVVRRY
jgi:repressor LexA